MKLKYEDEAKFNTSLIMSEVLKWIEENTEKKDVTRIVIEIEIK
jgi:hypothetical protein